MPRMGVGVDTERILVQWPRWHGLGCDPSPSPSLDLGVTQNMASYFLAHSAYLSGPSHALAPSSKLQQRRSSLCVSLLLLPPTLKVPSGTVCILGMQLCVLLACLANA